MRRSPILMLFLCLLLALLPAACSKPAAAPATAPKDAAQAEKLSDAGLFQVSYSSALAPISLNETHSWTLHIATPDGAPVDNAEIRINGGMPAHGHGLPTRPQVTKALGNGNYQIEGFKFQMGGLWEVHFDITANGQSDGVTFELSL